MEEIRTLDEKLLKINQKCNIFFFLYKIYQVNKTGENYLKYMTEKVEKTKLILENKKEIFLKSKENEQKRFSDNLSKFMDSFSKAQEIIKSIFNLIRTTLFYYSFIFLKIKSALPN